ncbi:6-phosphogluconolactonase [Aestuariibacter salexigens]|uniref:6-phosphogluconolactonase n=1 Tax=Aestuariibacter salexigens TaxID=226010 RepID=UPI0003FEE4CD|nr:6-phosphogluconolactonase [Aestuariibacter salexigens]
MSLHIQTFKDSDELTAQFARQIADILEQNVKQYGQASLIVSGGRTPVALFETLSTMALPWDSIIVSLADERWVNADDEASNEKLVRTHLLKDNAAAAQFVPLKTDHDDAKDAVQTLSQNQQLLGAPFDVLILGMGEDGHTASLFPCSEQVQAGLDMNSGQRYIAVQPTTAPHQRMSLTLPALLNSRHIFLHLTGERKREVLEQALAEGNEVAKPIVAVVQRSDVELMWAP